MFCFETVVGLIMLVMSVVLHILLETVQVPVYLKYAR